MTAKLDLRRAVDDTNRIFAQFYTPLCIPLVSIGIIGAVASAVQTLPGHHFGWFFIASLVTLALSICSFYAQALAPAMYIRARAGLAPSIDQIREVADYRGLWSIYWGLLGRGLAWGIPLAAAAYGVNYLQPRLLEAIYHHPFAMPALTDARGIGHWILIVVGVPIFSRYSLALPLLAIFRGSMLDLVDLSVKMVKPVLRHIVLLAYAFAVPGGVALVVASLSPWHPSTLAARLAVDIWWTAISQCYTAWSLLLMTAVALQLMEQGPSAENSTSDSFAGNGLLPPLEPEGQG